TAAGDMAGAWRYLRAMLRGSALLGRHGFPIMQIVGDSQFAGAAVQAQIWAADPRVDAALLRAALADAQAARALAPRASDGVRIGFLAVDRAFPDAAAL